MIRANGVPNSVPFGLVLLWLVAFLIPMYAHGSTRCPGKKKEKKKKDCSKLAGERTSVIISDSCFYLEEGC